MLISADSSGGLQEERLDAVVRHLRARKVRSVLDLGCGDGDLLLQLAREPTLQRIVGIDICPAALQAAGRRLDMSPQVQDERLSLRHHSFTTRDDTLAGFDAAVMLETIEHVDSGQLPEVEDAVFDCYRAAFRVDHDAEPRIQPALRTASG